MQMVVEDKPRKRREHAEKRESGEVMMGEIETPLSLNKVVGPEYSKYNYKLLFGHKEMLKETHK